MATWVTAKEYASDARKRLKAHYKGLKFSVKKNSAGNVWVTWTGGPDSVEVRGYVLGGALRMTGTVLFLREDAR